MSKIYLSSDLHFFHDKEFIYKPRGFENVSDMNETILKNWNNTVSEDDEVYLLGDLMLGDNNKGIELIKQLNGKIHVILGNHDSQTRKNMYLECPNIIEICYATQIKYKGYSFYLSHYPTLTATLDTSKHLQEVIINLFGHTHQTVNFYNEIPYMYHVGVDSHNNTPVLLDDIIKECSDKATECLNIL